MVDRKVVKLNMTQAEAATYRPPPGVNVTWLEWLPSKKAVIAEFSASDVQPDPLLRRSAKDITHELGTSLRNRIIDNNMGTYHLSPRRIMRVEALLDHPFLKDAPREVKRNVEAATDVHELAVPKEAVEQMARGRKGAKIEPKEVRHVKRSEGAKYDQELYVFDVGEIDSG